jgi:hypothetical protein
MTTPVPLLLGNQPLLFPMTPVWKTRADTFLKLNEGRGLDVRWAGRAAGWLNDGYTLMQDNAIACWPAKSRPRKRRIICKWAGQWFEPAPPAA